MPDSPGSLPLLPQRLDQLRADRNSQGFLVFGIAGPSSEETSGEINVTLLQSQDLTLHPQTCKNRQLQAVVDAVPKAVLDQRQRLLENR